VKVVWIPKDQRVIPPWVKGPRPWVVVARLVEDTAPAAKP
jgi:hypothetical protein